MVSLVVVNVACLGGVNVAGDRCGVRVVVGRRGGGRVGREGGNQASCASFLICLTSLSKQGLAERSGRAIRPHEDLGAPPGVRVAFAALSAFVPDPFRLRRGRGGSEAVKMVE